MADIRGMIDELAPRVVQAWGPALRYDLELRVALLDEIAAAKVKLGAEQWSAALAEFFTGPKPRAVAPALLAMLRRAREVPVARVVETTAFVPTAMPTAAPSRYHAALERLLGACARPTRVQ